jgi:hypothetical protein
MSVTGDKKAYLKAVDKFRANEQKKEKKQEKQTKKLVKNLTSPSKAPSKYHSGFASQEVKKVKIL